MRSRPIRLVHARFTPALSLLLIWVSAAAAATAQVTPIEPVHLTVAGDNVMLRCAEWSFAYPVAFLDRGQILIADGRDDDDFRVRFPRRVPALIEADDAEFDEARGAVVLTKESRLLAHNVSKTAPESWKALLRRPLPVGAELTYLETKTDTRGEVTGYLVQAPEGARGYVADQFVRPATTEEIVNWRQGDEPPRADAQDDETQPDQPADQPRVADADDQTRPEAPPEDAVDAPTDEPALATAADEDAQDAAAEAGDDARAEDEPVDTVAATMSQDVEPVDDAIIEDEQPEPEVLERDTPTIEQLDEAFDAIMEEPIRNAELEPLIDEHQRYLADTPDTEENVAERQYVQNRIDLLQIRLDLQEDLLRLDRLEASAARDADAIERDIMALSRNRTYEAVGLLTTSTLYDGVRLPRMYRLQSIDAAGGRTIAYILPTEQVDLDANLGSIVGVEGEEQLDANLRLTVIRPTRIDHLTTPTR